MSDKNHLYLVDGSSYIFRAYHRLPPLTNPNGVPVGAVYGYTTMLWKLAKDLHDADGPTHLAVILDHSSQSFRNEIYDQYKANRPEPPEDLRPQFPLIRDATRAFSLPCIETEGFEADDLIASYTEAAVAAGWDVTIVSSDKDLMQLIREPTDGPHVDMLDTMKNVRLGLEAVNEKFGVTPDLVGDVLALMGDSVDNVPGVRGVGPKTATKLIVEYGDLEKVLAGAETMKTSKLRENLIEHADMARLSRVLVELKRDCPLPDALDDLKLGAIPPLPLKTFLDEHGFRSLSAKLDLGGTPGGPPTFPRAAATPSASANNAPSTPALPPMPAIDRSLYETVTTLDALDRWIAAAQAAHVVAVDTETASLDSVTGRLVGVSLATAPGKACYIPLGHGGTDMFAEKPEQIAMDSALGRLRGLFVDDAVLKVGHNLKYDIGVLAQHDITIAPYDDTLVMSFALDAGKHQHGLDELAKLHLDHICLTFKEMCGTGKSQISFAEVQLDRATEYAAEDADVALRLWKLLKLRLPIEGGTRVYEMVDRPLAAIIEGMERAGIMVDRDYLARLSGEFATEMLRIEGEIHALAGQPFAIGSPKQLGEILFDKLGLKGGRKGKSGDWSTDQNELERLERDGVPIARKILEWRQLSKLKSTYTDALQQQINPTTGRVHTSYSLVGAQTGRLSSTDPNLQNIPIRTETGRQIRDAFIAAPGHVLIAADYSQIELRLAAHMADVPELKEAFAQGQDIHAATAIELFGESNRDTRGKAKTVNFSILYGISRWGLAGRLEITPDEAQALIARYFERFPGISDYITDTLESVRATGYTETLFGRKTWFPRIKAANQNERAGSERAAINAPIQGTSADLIKRAMARMPAALADAGLSDVKMLLQVHDELVFEAPEGQAKAAGEVIRAVMAGAAEPALTLSVPLDVEIGIGKSWGEAH
ncbi:MULTISPECIES: DNA polymerase I [unclassified Sphingopyxis]|uniref:DNA polymerase I n=1 Tax=unclassified Sphingopyxis TaxID=2614943 RepID=UPI002861298E|nr:MULTISPECIES: DNA polymerase I [unclassified Sphingopyxis]MDR6834572.1 DNA polymerase-1 [Sphingopyxis sp. BE122]MDR7226842.1 DNA polymerase-1 [Sphingopyxis sp. BE259]